MTIIRAVQLIRGDFEASSAEILDAWQFLYDTGAIYKLPGYFGRQMLQLINAGRVRTNKNGYKANI